MSRSWVVKLWSAMWLLLAAGWSDGLRETETLHPEHANERAGEDPEEPDEPEDSESAIDTGPGIPPSQAAPVPPSSAGWLNGGTQALTALNLARFWAIDRFILDGDKGLPTREELERTLLTKAQADECFAGIGQPTGSPPCSPEEGQPKTNDAYVWGLTLERGAHGDALWFGTVANTHCLVLDGFIGLRAAHENRYWTCEFGSTAYPHLSELIPGDLRPPNLFRYDLASNRLELKNPPLGSPADFLRRITIGLRSAGNASGVIFLAGPTLIGGISMFAFDADTGALLGARAFPEFGDIRSIVTVNGVLYTGVALSDIPSEDAPGGAVLRWVGHKTSDPAVLFAFDTVGKLDANAANIAEHNGRLYVTTWPTTLDVTSGSGAIRYMGLWRSPRLDEDGLDTFDAGLWAKLWDIRDYETDAIAAATTGGGALASFDGRLYWGTMHVPFLATTTAVGLHAAGQIDLDADRNGSLDTLELVNTALGSHRSITIFQGRNLGGSEPRVRILYGEKFLPRYTPEVRGYAVAYDNAYRNNMPNPNPRFGSSGLGNFFNAYTWSMQVFGKDLYVGTFDWSQLARVGIQDLHALPTNLRLPMSETQALRTAIANAARDFILLLNVPLPNEGADLFRFGHRHHGADAESLTGVGNFTNYGVRTMQANEASLFIGTANPMNLHPQGGWELLELED